jgi:hypothetical protein
MITALRKWDADSNVLYRPPYDAHQLRDDGVQRFLNAV